jgi:hypothetical protein
MRIYVLVALLILAGCTRPPEGDPVVAVQEAVFRYQFDRNASVQQKRADVYFLAFGDLYEEEAIDPPNEFISRFATLKPRVAKYSEAGRSDTHWVTDKKTERGGVVFFVHSVRIIDRDTAEAKGGYLEHSRSASGNTYQLKLGWRGWRVVHERLDRISKKPNQRSEPMAVLRTAMAYR